MEQCGSSLVRHQAELPDSSSTGAPAAQPHANESLSQAKMHPAGLEQGQRSFTSLEHRLQHALSLSGPQDPGSSGPLGQQLEEVQESVKR
jgi:hypothetical protein